MKRQSISFLLLATISFVAVYGAGDQPSQDNNDLQLSRDQLLQKTEHQEKEIKRRRAALEARRAERITNKKEVSDKEQITELDAECKSVAVHGMDNLSSPANDSSQLSGELLQQETERRKQLLAEKQAELEAKKEQLKRRAEIAQRGEELDAKRKKKQEAERDRQEKEQWYAKQEEERQTLLLKREEICKSVYFFGDRYSAMRERMKQHEKNFEAQLQIAQEEIDAVDAMTNISPAMQVERDKHKEEVADLQKSLNKFVALAREMQKIDQARRVTNFVKQGNIVEARQVLAEMEDLEDRKKWDDWITEREMKQCEITVLDLTRQGQFNEAHQALNGVKDPKKRASLEEDVISNYERLSSLKANLPTPEEINQIAHKRALEDTLCFFVPCALLVGGVYGVSKICSYLFGSTKVSTRELEQLICTFDQQSNYNQRQARRLLHKLASQVWSHIAGASSQQKMLLREIHHHIMGLTERDVTCNHLVQVINMLRRVGF